MSSQRYFGARPYWDLATRAGSRTLHLTWAKIGSQCPFTMILMSLEEKELWGHPFMTSTKKITFLTPLPLSTCVHMGRTPSPLWTSTHGRHEIHTVLLKWLVR